MRLSKKVKLTVSLILTIFIDKMLTIFATSTFTGLGARNTKWKAFTISFYASWLFACASFSMFQYLIIDIKLLLSKVIINTFFLGLIKWTFKFNIFTIRNQEILIINLYRGLSLMLILFNIRWMWVINYFTLKSKRVSF